VRFKVSTALTVKNVVFWDIITQVLPHRSHSATGTSRLMICKFRGFHGGDCEECRLLGCYAIQKTSFFIITHVKISNH
jgi:hypothetical protein